MLFISHFLSYLSWILLQEAASRHNPVTIMSLIENVENADEKRPWSSRFSFLRTKRAIVALISLVVVSVVLIGKLDLSPGYWHYDAVTDKNLGF